MKLLLNRSELRVRHKASCSVYTTDCNALCCCPHLQAVALGHRHTTAMHAMQQQCMSHIKHISVCASERAKPEPVCVGEHADQADAEQLAAAPGAVCV